MRQLFDDLPYGWPHGWEVHDDIHNDNDDENDENLRLFGKYAKVYVTKLSVILPNK